MIGVIILAAGKGNRMKLGYNKMFCKINNKELYKIVLERFEKIDEIVLVVNEEDKDKFIVNKNTKIVVGGKERTQSVYKGLQAIKSEHVLIHDGARVFVSDDIINRCIKAALKYDAFFVGVKVKDTIKEISNKTYKTLNRENLIYAQTPQGGKTSLFKDVYEKGKQDIFFDDVALVEKYSNKKIDFVLGDYENIKVTTMEDLV